MDTLTAIDIIEGTDGADHTQDEVAEAFQSLIDSGTVWSLQGFYGRMAMNLINEGICHHKSK